MMETMIRLHPSDGQKEQIERTFDCCCVLWNRMIADEKKLQAEMGRHFLPTPAKYKRELPQLKQVDSLALSSVHKDLEKAYRNHTYNPHDFEEPKPMEHSDSYVTFCQQTKSGPTIRFEGTGLKLPKIGSVKVDLHRELPMGATIKSAVVSKSDGSYFCTLTYEAAPMPAAAAKTVLEEMPA